MKAMSLLDRDLTILEFCLRWRCATASVIAIVAGFKSIANAERRLRQLEAVGFIKRKKVIASEPIYCTCSTKGAKQLGYLIAEYTFNPGGVLHEAGVAEIAAYLCITENITIDDLRTDRDILLAKKTGTNLHRADMITSDGLIGIEYERTPKKNDDLKRIFRANEKRYKGVIYFCPESPPRIKNNLENLKKNSLVEIEIVSMEEVRKKIEKYNLKEKKGKT
ncbi:MAG: hypothetical protein LBD41_04240 [Clostridiales Family XIII bacterium]|jgi:hypothetical protein|nr:hypothetical protein [Clostridiales Family XIII bacterium]